MSEELDLALRALEGVLSVTPIPTQGLDLAEAMLVSAKMVAARQPFLAQLENAQKAGGGLPKDDTSLRAIALDIADRDARWMALLQALRSNSQQQALSRRRLKQWGSRAKG